MAGRQSYAYGDNLNKRYLFQKYKNIEDFEMGCEVLALDHYLLVSFSLSDNPGLYDFLILAVFQKAPASRIGQMIKENQEALT